MGEYVRKYPEAPTAEEVEQGYAPSTIRGTPFAKFLFWTFAGLAITYGIAYGTYVILDRMESTEAARDRAISIRRSPEFLGPRVQPSAAHPTIDFEDMNILRDQYKAELKSKGLWHDLDAKENPQYYGRPGFSEAALHKAEDAIRNWKPPATQPSAEAH